METHRQQIIGEAPAFLEMLEQVSRAAPLNKPVLVVGERGTGKELIASRLHFLSGRWEQPLVKVNCAALTESILESELFGHEAGAFTGALKRHIGHFERADGGTLVLDELATIPLRVQEKILRVIEYGEIQRVGGNETIRVEVRIVGSTNADLESLVRSNQFRVDLLDRLAFDVITIPPLRERLEDILPLAYAFAINMTAELHQEFFAGFTARSASALLRHPWPGNVRELKNTVERSVYKAKSAEKQISQIAFDPFDSPYRLRSADQEPAATAGLREKRHTPALPTDLAARVSQFEKQHLEAALDKSRYNQGIAAELLGLSYDQLRGRMKKHGLSGKAPG
jgi:psp operon transcriptional activator